MAAFDKVLSCTTWPQHILLGPICPSKHQLSCQPFSQKPLQQGRKASRHQKVRCAAATSKDAIKQPAAQDVSDWGQSMGIESSGLRVAEFAGDRCTQKRWASSEAYASSKYLTSTPLPFTLDLPRLWGLSAFTHLYTPSLRCLADSNCCIGGALTLPKTWLALTSGRLATCMHMHEQACKNVRAFLLVGLGMPDELLPARLQWCEHALQRH